MFPRVRACYGIHLNYTLALASNSVVTTFLPSPGWLRKLCWRVPSRLSSAPPRFAMATLIEAPSKPRNKQLRHKGWEKRLLWFSTVRLERRLVRTNNGAGIEDHNNREIGKGIRKRENNLHEQEGVRKEIRRWAQKKAKWLISKWRSYREKLWEKL